MSSGTSSVHERCDETIELLISEVLAMKAIILGRLEADVQAQGESA